MYVVMTRVKLRPGTSEKCAELFRQTNPDVVEDEADWLGAQMIFDNETNIVTVLAIWRDAESYRKMSASDKFKSTMSRFSQYFAAAPEVSVNRVLVDIAQ
jgi:heme-degrading monooxygenase HmoA